MPTSHSEDVKDAKCEPATPASIAEELNFDQVLDRLRQVVQRLEQGSLPLDHALKAFEEGVKLSRRGSAILDAAEQRVELLLRDDDGTERRQPMAQGAAPEPRSDARADSRAADSRSTSS